MPIGAPELYNDPAVMAAMKRRGIMPGKENPSMGGSTVPQPDNTVPEAQQGGADRAIQAGMIDQGGASPDMGQESPADVAVRALSSFLQNMRTEDTFAARPQPKQRRVPRNELYPR